MLKKQKYNNAKNSKYRFAISAGKSDVWSFYMWIKYVLLLRKMPRKHCEKWDI